MTQLSRRSKEIKLGQKRLDNLAQDAAKHFGALAARGSVPQAFSFRGYAVTVTKIDGGYSLALFNNQGDFLTNIAC